MAYKLPGKLASVQITDLGVQDGTPGTGTPVVMTALLRRATVRGSMATTDMTAVADNVRAIQVTHEEDEATLDFFIPATGAQLRSLLGHYVTLEWKELSTLAFSSLAGVVTGHEYGIEDAQTESITIMAGAN